MRLAEPGGVSADLRAAHAGAGVVSGPPALTYDGGPCGACGGTERYISNQNCVACARARRERMPQAGRRPAARDRETARATGAPRYLAAPCRVCGCRERYTLDGKCAQKARHPREPAPDPYRPAGDDEIEGMAYARATVELFRAGGWHCRRASVRRACKYGDPLCPCQDGDSCHYEGENPMTPRRRA